jgi:hypothetical protein
VLRLELNVSGKVRWGEMRGPNGAGIYARAPHAP